MKNIYFLLAFCTQQLFAQDNIPVNSLAANQLQSISPRVLFKENGSYRKAYINNIPSEILADFMRRYDGATEITWIVDGQQLTGYFSYNKEKVTVNYKRGYLESTKRTYDGSLLNNTLTYFLRNEFAKGYVAELVTEVTSEGYTQYEVRMVKDRQYCVARVAKYSDGGLDLLEKFYYNDVSGKY